MPDGSGSNVEISSLSINVEASTSNAAKELDQLASALSRLAANSKVTKTVNNLTKLQSALSGFGASTAAVQNLSKLSTALNGLSGVQKLSGLNSALNTLAKLPTVTAGLNPQAFTALANAVRPLSDALAGMGDIQKLAGLNSALNTLKKIPQVTEGLKNANLDEFAAQLQKVKTAVAPLASEMDKVSKGFSSLPAYIQKAIAANQKYASSTRSASASVGGLSGKVQSLAGSFSFIYLLNRAWDALGSSLANFNDYVENVNLFRVSMGDLADEATEATNKMQELLGVDASTAMRNMGVIQNLVTSFGLASDQAYILSKNMTQLGYDMASFFNLSIEDSFQKLQAAISGELEPIRRLGVDISEARLQQELWERGINASVSSLSQADKAVLRYIAIMEQTTNAQTDMARTLTSPANQIRVFQQQLTLLARSIGSLLIPMLNAILPPLIAFVQVIREAISAVAAFIGVEVTFADMGSSSGASLGGVSSGLDNVGSSAAGAAEEMRELIGGFDELNRLPDPSSASGGGGGGGIGGGNILGDLELPSYDMFEGLQAKANDIAQRIKDAFQKVYDVLEPFIPLLKGIAAAIAAAFIAKKVYDFWKTISTLLSTSKLLPAVFDAIRAGALGFTTAFEGGAGLMKSFGQGLKSFQAAIPLWVKIATVVATAVGSFVTAYDAFKKLGQGALSLNEALGNLVVGVGLFATVAGVVAGPVGAVVAVVAGAAGAFLGYRSAVQEAAQAAYESSIEYQIANEIMEANAEIAQRCAAGQEALADKISSINEVATNYNAVRKLTDEIFDLSENSNKSASEIVELRAKVNLLNGLNIDGLQLTMNETGTAVLETRQEVDALVDSLQEVAYQAALQDVLTEAYKQQMQAQMDLQTATQNYSAALEGYNEAKAAQVKYEQEAGVLQEFFMDMGLDKTYEALSLAVDEYGTALEDSKAQQEAANDLYKKSSDAADFYAQQLADVQSGTKTVDELTRGLGSAFEERNSVVEDANEAMMQSMEATQQKAESTAAGIDLSNADIASSYASAYSSVNSSASQSAQSVAQSTMSATSSLRGGASSMQGVASSYAASYGGINSAASNSANAVAMGTNNAVSSVNNGARQIESSLSGLGSKALGWASDMMNGFVNGISRGWRAFTGAVDGIANYIFSNLHFSRPDIGPLRDYETWMPDMMHGMARSLTQNVGVLYSAIDNMTSGMQVRLAVQGTMEGGSLTMPRGLSNDDDSSSAEIVEAINQLLAFMQEQDDPAIIIDGERVFNVVRKQGRRAQMRTGKNPWLG